MFIEELKGGPESDEHRFVCRFDVVRDCFKAADFEDFSFIRGRVSFEDVLLIDDELRRTGVYSHKLPAFYYVPLLTTLFFTGLLAWMQWDSATRTSADPRGKLVTVLLGVLVVLDCVVGVCTCRCAETSFHRSRRYRFHQVINSLQSTHFATKGVSLTLSPLGSYFSLYFDLASQNSSFQQADADAYRSIATD